MRRLGDLLSRRTGEDSEGSALYAAAVVAAVNEQLQNHWPPADAEATSFQRGTVRVWVSHGAVAGRLQHKAADIIQAANTVVHQRFPTTYQPILRLTARLR